MIHFLQKVQSTENIYQSKSRMILFLSIFSRNNKHLMALLLNTWSNGAAFCAFYEIEGVVMVHFIADTCCGLS